MKFIIIILSLLSISSFVLGQDSLYLNRVKAFKRIVFGKYDYKYDNANCSTYFDQAKSLIKLNDPDSSYKATIIMWGLCVFDTTKYSVRLFKPLLKKIKVQTEKNYQRHLPGDWRFITDFIDGMTTQVYTTSDADTNNVIRFKGHTAYFYFKDSLFRKTAYKIEPEQTIAFSIHFSIHFMDKNEHWLFHFEQNLYGSKETMVIKIDPNCQCGCRNNFYKKLSTPIKALPQPANPS